MSKTTQSKSRPIIFNSEMVNAILENRKTMTRRVIKPQPLHDYSVIAKYKWHSCPKIANKMRWVVRDNNHLVIADKSSEYFKPPYEIGMKLWVRETCSIVRKPNINYPSYDWRREGNCSYKADEKKAVGMYGVIKWKSPIYMPKWASRLTLEITDIKVERLQDISEEDALAEGIIQLDSKLGFMDVRKTEGSIMPSAKDAFMLLWQSIKGSQSWSSNPFVWILEFKKEVSDEK